MHRAQDRRKYIPVGCGGDIPVADAPARSASHAGHSPSVTRATHSPR